MKTTRPVMQPASAVAPRAQWKPFLLKRDVWQESLEKALNMPGDSFGRREMIVQHPDSDPEIGGMAPGVEVRFGVIAPGTATLPLRTNASLFFLVLRGEIELKAGGVEQHLGFRDSVVVPGMQGFHMANTGTEPAWYICYSNAALLKYMRVFYEEAETHAEKFSGVQADGFKRARDVAGPGHVLNETGAHILPYEYLIDPDTVASKVLVWRWNEIENYLPTVKGIPDGYDGRRLWILYNPSTERRIGTTPSFFASMASSPAGSSTNSHRHASVAINLHLDGHGHSYVNGERLDWSDGDLLLSAPGWSPHGHHFEGDSTVLTVQDHPLHVATESLIWQEQLPSGPIRNLGTESGFSTNRANL